MILFNNRYISNYKIILLFVDTALILFAAALGYHLRFPWKEYPIIFQNLIARGVFFTFMFQLSLYYFELYDLKIIRDGSKFGFRLVQSVTITVIALTIAYYIYPTLYLGRGVLLFSISLATAGVFFWRIIYRNFVKGRHLNERILILGTGEFAREIARQIREKRDSGFEVVGYINEKKGDKHEQTAT